MTENRDQHERLLRSYLEALGARPGDPRLADTPRIFTALLGRFLEERSEPELTLFPAEGPAVVTLRGLRFYSLCEHHLLPFFGHVDILYAPAERVCGFGGVERCIAHLSTRLQLQERFTNQLADLLHRQLTPHGLIVESHARQLCLEMTGGSPEATVRVVACRGGYNERDAAALLGNGRS